MALPFEAVERAPVVMGERWSKRESSWPARARTALLVLLWIALATVVAAPGMAYYALPLEARAFATDHARFAPTGTTGLRLGIAGTAMMLIGVASYMARKRWGVLARFGKLRHWLVFHIFLCTLGPFFILLHTSFKVGGLVSIAFWSMTLVVASGVFGRYVYARIPKSLNGTFRTKQELAEERALLVREIAEAESANSVRLLARVQQVVASTAPVSTGGALLRTLRFDRSEHKRERELRRMLETARVPATARGALLALLRRERELERQIALVAPFQRLFRYWHLFHLPLALVMLAILAVHIAVAVLLGYAWPF